MHSCGTLNVRCRAAGWSPGRYRSEQYKPSTQRFQRLPKLNRTVAPAVTITIDRDRNPQTANLAPAEFGFMAQDALKVLVLAGRLRWDEGGWPLPGLIDRLQERGASLQVLCVSRRGGATDNRVIEYPMLKKRWLRSLAARRIWSDGRLQSPDLLHVADLEMADLALAMSETRRLPYVQTVAGFDALERGLRLSRRWCRRLIATNPDLFDELVRELGVPSAGITLVPPGVPTARDFPPEDRGWKVPVIGTGGPFEGVSGLVVFLDAAHLIVNAGYDVEFLIASPASEHAMLRHRARWLEISERVTVAEYPIVGPEFWSVVDIYCQPALVASAGRTLAHALAHAVPSIATSVRGLRVLIDSGENGLIVPPGDPIALQQAILLFLDQPEEARRLGRRALERARAQFDLDIEADRLAGLYRQVAS
jgi:glycosyltransferase involved in cell wall biosynthesis